MKRLLAAVMSMVMVVSAANLPALAIGGPAKVADAVGDFTTAVRLDYPELLENVEGKEFSLTLADNEGNKIPLNLTAGGESGSFQFAGENVTVTTTLLNEQGVEITTENTVGYYEVAFQGLPNNRKYTVSLKANGYSNYTSQPIEMEAYSRKILVGTWEGGFSIGDVTGDKRIDGDDLNAVLGSLGKTGKQATDITLDNVVDIEDLALVHSRQGAKGEAAAFDTAVIVAAVTDTEDILEGFREVGTNVVGDIADLFLNNGETVQLEAKGDIVLPFSFEKNPIETESIQITSPQGTGSVEAGTAEVVYTDENGKEQTENIPFTVPQAPQGVHAIGRNSGSNTLVIDLGKRVAVKKVTITVSKVEGEPGYAIVESIQFLKDIVPENAEITNSIPMRVTATAGSKEAVLSWKSVDNVDGYIVRWGEEPGKYTKELKVSLTKATVVGLENLKTYYFIVQAYTEDGWKGGYSEVVSAVPQPNKVPPAPDYLTVEPQDRALTISWKKTKDALKYNVYYKETDQEQSAFKKVEAEITATSYALGGLENGTSYDIYVTAENNLGEGPKSLMAQGVPEKQIVEAPDLPTENRIPNSKITKVTMTNPNNVDMSYYPNGFEPGFVADDDYSTHWTAKSFGLSMEFIFEFDEEQDMNYLLYMPRQDGRYCESLVRYTITAWDEQGNEYNLTPHGGTIKNQVKTDRYAIFSFERCNRIKKIGVAAAQWEGSPTPVSLSEVAFYKYTGVEDQIDALFTDSSKTALSSSATEAEIARLKQHLEEMGNYYINKEVLQDEVNLAEELRKGNQAALGLVKEGLFSISTKNDVRGFSTLQPLGAVAGAGETVAIYANIPEGETVSLVPTQYYSEVNRWKGAAITLTNGRNIVKIPTLTSLSTEKGGSLYLVYSGNKGNEIKLHVRGKGVTAIPTLELYNWYSLNETQRREKIAAYTNELSSYVAGLNTSNIQTNIRNATEISLPGVLLSLPANTVNQGIQKAKISPEEQLYQNALAWEQMMDLMYKTHGVDNPREQQSRNNIRYHRMFAGAFMYAAGAHIGVGYGSTSGLVLGLPVDGDSGQLFGWGIAHEIGHNMDTLGHAEITNNIYSLFAQTYGGEGSNNTKTSRLEASNKYPKVFDKTSSGAKGLSNDVFTQLAMYWQLHLAYDDADGNFYNLVNKAYRQGAGAGFTGDEKFAVVASQVANKDLTEFFTQWGVELSQGAKAEMGSYTPETRKIHYLSDESRRQRLGGAGAAQGTVSITANAVEKEVTVTINASINGEMQGYEILRNGTPHAFIPAGEPLTFTEIIGSSNHKAMEYQVKAIDILGNVVDTSNKEQVSIDHNNEIDRDQWTAQKAEDGTLTVSFTKEPVRVSGMVFKNIASLENVVNEEATLPPEQPETDAAEDKTPDTPPEGNTDGKVEEDANTPPEGNVEGKAEQGSAVMALAEGDKDSQQETVEDNNTTDVKDTTGESAVNGEETANKENLQDENTADGNKEATSGEDLQNKETAENKDDGKNKERAAEPGKIVIAVKEENKDFVHALTIDLAETDLTDPKNALQLFNSGYTNGKVSIFENAVEIRITGLPDSVTEENFNFAGYPGDLIEFMDGAIGHLAHDYQYGEDSSQVIPAGTLVIAGTYRGDPVYSTIRILGEFMTGDPAADEAETEERAINGEAYLFAEVPDGGKLSEINNGIWIFVPDVQAEKDLQENECSISVLPGRIKAELYRTDDPEDATSKRKTSDTKWISSPTEETMPSITLQGEN